MNGIALRTLLHGVLAALTIAVAAHWLWLWEQREGAAAFTGPACQVPQGTQASED